MESGGDDDLDLDGSGGVGVVEAVVADPSGGGVGDDVGLHTVVGFEAFGIEGAIGFGRFGRFHNVYPPLTSGGVQIVARKPPI